MNDTLPESLFPDGLRGRVRAHADLSKINWFQVGGPAEWLFRPEDAQDLAAFLRHHAAHAPEVPITIIGVGSNLIVRDGGINGVVIRLGKGFAGIRTEGTRLTAGASALCLNVARAAQDAGIAGLEYLCGIPGTIGGVLYMNGGAYGKETKDVLVEARVLDDRGEAHAMDVAELDYSYRRSELPKGWIFTEATFEGSPGDPEEIRRAIGRISAERDATQPVRERTGGSTFKNPEGKKAWKLIEEAGLRGHTIGGAQVSQRHCNFLINTGGATAADLENLGNYVREKVKKTSGIELQWEIRILGKPA